MSLPQFNKDIPVSVDKFRPNRYGYSNPKDILDEYQIEYGFIEKDGISTDVYELHSMYTLDSGEMYYAKLFSIDHSLVHLVYFSKELQLLLKEGIRIRNNSNKDFLLFSYGDLYLCLENYIDKNNIVCYRYVIDIHLHAFYNAKTKITIENEINDLVSFFKPMGFTKSSQVSNYIRLHRLGYRYPNISGFLKLQRDGDEWEMEGAIAPRYFAEICERLGLVHSKNAEPLSYESYKERGIFD